VVVARPEWGAVLVDLREHGGSQGFAAPHTIEACADDVGRLIEQSGKPAAVLGHSFGGKVALCYAGRKEAALRATFVIDSTPERASPRGDSWAVLGVAKALPVAFATREECVRALMEKGITESIARWFAMNVSLQEGRYRWRLDFGAIEALLENFFQKDLWKVIEEAIPSQPIMMVKAEGAEVLHEGSVARLETLGAHHGAVRVRRVAGGHWLNADNPEAMVALLVEGLPLV
jgi:pimeloyl-ACP methyl ester carboxylesterase